MALEPMIKCSLCGEYWDESETYQPEPELDPICIMCEYAQSWFNE